MTGNIYNAGLDDPRFTQEDRKYFESSDFRNLPPSSKVAFFKQRLEERSKPSAPEIEEKNRRDDEAMRRIYEDRAQAEEARIAAIQQRQAELKRRFLN